VQFTISGIQQQAKVNKIAMMKVIMKISFLLARFWPRLLRILIEFPLCVLFTSFAIATRTRMLMMLETKIVSTPKEA
jgi:hypothetical protein